MGEGEGLGEGEGVGEVVIVIIGPEDGNGETSCPRTLSSGLRLLISQARLASTKVSIPVLVNNFPVLFILTTLG